MLSEREKRWLHDLVEESHALIKYMEQREIDLYQSGMFGQLSVAEHHGWPTVDLTLFGPDLRRPLLQRAGTRQEYLVTVTLEIYF
jgi:hypothetical protein